MRDMKSMILLKNAGQAKKNLREEKGNYGVIDK
jgi:hypothetical protein